MLVCCRSSLSLLARATMPLCCSRRFLTHQNNIDDISGPVDTNSNSVSDGRLHCSTGEGGKASTCERVSLRTIAESLGAAAAAELRAEVERDTRDGVAAIPPLPPLGWRVRHPSGSNYFVMTRTLKNGVQSAELNNRRYRSVHDIFLQSLQKGGHKYAQKGKGSEGRQKHAKEEEEPPSQEDGKSSPKVTVGYDREGRGHRATLQRMDELHDSPKLSRADVHLTVFAPFRVYDPSLHDPTVDICEWSSFDLVVQKTVPDNRVANKLLQPLSCTPQDGALSMYVCLASVNSEMRIRSIQLLSMKEAQALVEHACFGNGEPLFLELLRRRGRRRPLVERRFDDPRLRYEEVAQPQQVADEAAVACSSSCYGPYYPAFEMLMDSCGSAGEYSRALCYGGPYVSELSRELCDALLDYIKGDLGVSDQLCEYVCQMQFFLEQEEYMTWLGQVQHVANAVSRTA
ncbi:hypothetical protein, conserved [Trypanosoma brucei gambiense DAL972]|uniref:Mitochondrial glycoprotein n=1 Tax=Trypanosoma brucei gambiense (strain MHOM/CI/86/DAL972) TaxID=679716 RepID=D0A6K1_TRYB9|nr:hypothetical protein, conserved [Trypanosoma brucei gambiense DAL972]CBH17302.1 hypothetical protein, conserved [Trypanosoma brucei gambiense DAL972]|eukprot:XP_011779566.1 hypothetical protein, conserved [Trypanosoma brucei gambiense DAL972]